MDTMEHLYREFVQSASGASIIADLNGRFGGNPFAADNPHVTSYRCGQLAVIGYILEQSQRNDHE